jgi:hypothetical protein
MNVEPTPQNKGLRLTLQIDAYDNGMVNVDGIPMSHHITGDRTDVWLHALTTAVITFEEFQRQVMARRVKLGRVA